MKKTFRSSLLALALVSVSSCALPPREAWRIVQHDGLIPYIAVEMGRRPVPPYVRLPAVTGSRFVTVTSSAKAPRAATAGAPGVYVARSSSSIPDTRYLAASTSGESRYSAPKATPAPVLTPPPRPVATPAPKPPTVSPTKPEFKPVPKPVPHPPVVASAVKPVKPVVDKSLPEELANVPRAKPMPAATAAGKPAAPDAKAEPAKPQTLAGKTTPPSAASVPATANTPAPAKTASVDTMESPFGIPIPGRPGLVNSPFAGKNQLVDVTGLEAGQEVKCPYTGKLFRVPGVQQAKNTNRLPTEPPPAKKAEADKKP